jgi:hypothetical protein
MVKVEEYTPEELQRACSFTDLIDKLYAETKAEFTFEKCVKKPADVPGWQDKFRRAVIKTLGIDDMLASKGEVVLVKGDPDMDVDRQKYTIEHFYIKSWMDTLIPVFLAKPKGLKKGQKVPAFVCTHGHGQGKDFMMGLSVNQNYPNSHWAADLSELGCITIAMDQWGWMERGFGGLYNFVEGAYAHKMLTLGRTINGLRFFDAMRQVDYLLTRDDVDPKKIGIGGLSLGGTTATWTAAIDPRISMALVAGYLNPFKDSILDHNHCSCNYIPGILKLGEMYDLAALIAPRPACYICGIKDTTFYIDPAREAFQKVKSVYKLLGKEGNCVIDECNLGHDWNGTVAYPFVKRHFFS